MTKLIWKDVEWRTKTANTVPTVFEQSSLLRVSGSISEKIIDWHQTITIKWLEKMLNEKQKEQILFPLSSNKSSLLKPSGSIFEKMVDWYQTIMINLVGKDVEWLTKPASTF